MPFQQQGVTLMGKPSTDISEKIRQQFDAAPYPRVPLEDSPKKDTQMLYIHDLVTAYYMRHQRVISPTGKVILDAGCGSGYKSLILAEANPGAKIIGVDLSEESVKLARERLKYHGFEDAIFHAITIEELPSLGLEFDYINCDEVLYLLPDPIAGLKAMKSVLKPDGIIRANFHDSLQRAAYHQAQELFSILGLMDGSPNEAQMADVRSIMKTLRPGALLKERTWQPKFEVSDQALLANHLLQGDKGLTIPEFFSILRASDLEFISMVNWWQWDLVQLFDDVNDLPIAVALNLAEKPIEEQLHVFELLHPYHRLLDLWCGHPGEAQPYEPIADWSDEQWHQSTAYLHPRFNNDSFKEDLITSITESSLFEISRHLQKTNEPINVDNLIASCLLLLLESPQPVGKIAQHWQKIRPLNLVTLEPTSDCEAFDVVIQNLIRLEQQGYILLEK
jgi:2-polyprenyl-3-methyl-5-hydroxy-6-metoxy-1,4-benzoquinol methylase